MSDVDFCSYWYCCFVRFFLLSYCYEFGDEMCEFYEELEDDV